MTCCEHVHAKPVLTVPAVVSVEPIEAFRLVKAEEEWPRKDQLAMGAV